MGNGPHNAERQRRYRLRQGIPYLWSSACALGGAGEVNATEPTGLSPSFTNRSKMVRRLVLASGWAGYSRPAFYDVPASTWSHRRYQLLLEFAVGCVGEYHHV